MYVAIGQSVGEGGVNKPNDLIQIDSLLRSIGLLGPVSPADAMRNDAIKQFQRIWGISSGGKFDGKIAPGGVTLARLNDTANPLKLHPIPTTPSRISHGGYKISFSPKPPPRPYQVWLGVSKAPGDYLDITGCNPANVMTVDTLPDLLQIIKRRNTWGQMLNIRLYVVLGNQLISESAPQPLRCPVPPHNGKMLPLDEDNNGPELTYQGDSAEGPFYGRMFHQFPDLDGYFFKYAGCLELDSAHRGFDCITYAGTACGAAITHMAASDDLANSLNAKKCYVEKIIPPAKVPTKIELEAADPQHVKDFFKDKAAGYFLMFSGGHIVVVANGVVHEFGYSKGGYDATPVEDWLKPYTHKKLTVRELPAKPALAV